MQGYFEVPFPEHSLRIRIIDDKSAFVTQKLGIGVMRKEREYPIDINVGKMLLESCAHVIMKKRYFFKSWTIDFFCGHLDGLIIAEKELTSLRYQKVNPPSWLVNARDITDSISNFHLARLATELEGTNAIALPEVYRLLSKKIPKIVLTGGPCSGKSSIMKSIQKKFGDSVHCVPEVATILISQLGISLLPDDQVARQRFSRSIYRIQKIFEATSAEHAASRGKKCLILDRGSIDAAAYMSGGLSEMEHIYQTTREAEYSQYDLVICLEVPPKDIYEKVKHNNPARSETYEQAERLGEKIREVWFKHPGFCLIPNYFSWTEQEDIAMGLVINL
ncbi:MAG: AAA family ATPase [Candidatus Nealsonbacteria bacterium]|nr:AAA family ATPase [Candidatus Nealsonbacteria bacterium]